MSKILQFQMLVQNSQTWKTIPTISGTGDYLSNMGHLANNTVKAGHSKLA